MLKLILRRVVVAIPTLILVSMIVFMLQKKSCPAIRC